MRAPADLAQLRAYGDPGRDPRGNVVTVAYLAAVPPLGVVVGGGDAAQAIVVAVDEILDGTRKLAFDHRRIVADAVHDIAHRLDGTDIALAFLGPTFTLSDVRTVHEAITGESIEPANFRRRLLTADTPMIEPTGQYGPSGAGGGRPAELFRRSSPVDRRRR